MLRSTWPTQSTIVQDQVDAYNARDLDGTLRYYADDAVIVDGGGAVIAEGLAAIRAAYARLHQDGGWGVQDFRYASSICSSMIGDFSVAVAAGFLHFYAN